MRTIATVALASLNKLRTKIHSDEWAKGEGYDLYKAWVELRRHNQHRIASPHEWAQTIDRCIADCIKAYSNPYEYKNILKRNHWVSTFNLRVMVTVMGGYRSHPQWETECKVFIEA